MSVQPNVRWWQIDLAGVLLCAVLSSVAYLAIVRPILRKHESFGEKQLQLKADKRRASKLAASELAHKRQLQLVTRALAASGVKLQPANRVNRQIAALTELVNQCGLKADDIQLGEVRRTGRYDAVPISLAGRGGYVTCAKFIRSLSQTFPDTGLASFEISGNPAVPSEAGRFRFGLLWHAAPSRKEAPE